MPSFASEITIDWGWRSLTPAERAIVRRHEAHLAADRGAHTMLTVSEILEAASRDLSSRVVRARVCDDRGEHLLRAFAGRCGPSQTFDPS